MSPNYSVTVSTEAPKFRENSQPQVLSSYTISNNEKGKMSILSSPGHSNVQK